MSISQTQKTKECYLKAKYDSQYEELYEGYLNIIRRYLRPGSTKTDAVLFAVKRMSEIIESEA